MAQKPDPLPGFKAGAQYWLFFMLIFALMRYPPLFCISFGAIGGIAGGMVAAWWKAKEDAEAKPKEEPEALSNALTAPAAPKSKPRFQQYGVFGLRPRRQRRAIRRFRWLFRRK